MLPLVGSGHALSPDATRIATWKARVVEVASLTDGKPLATLKVDSGDIDRVVFTDDDQIFVRYHKLQRVAAFDAHGKQKHRLAAKMPFCL